MKKLWILACVFLCASAASFAQTPSQPPLTSEALAAILGEPPVSGSCSPLASHVRFAAKQPRIGLEKALCTATATCRIGTVSCSSNSSTTSCSSANRNCGAGEQGHVTCDGVTTLCPCSCTGTQQQMACCQCAQTDDCVSCCICGGGRTVQCNVSCSGG
jgi:hypothetical protein